jgi:23S rRNA pseudouridine2457 synthase
LLLALHKPWGVLSQFTPDVPGQRTLAEFVLPKSVYPIGRLDCDSEGLLLLTDEKPLVDRLLNPDRGHPRTYWAQVEGNITPEALDLLRRGVSVQGRSTRPCQARLLDAAPDLPPCDPPIRFRKNIPTCWIELTLTEGRNRQVRRMTAAAGFPTLRLVRIAVGRLRLPDLPPGAWRELSPGERMAALGT